MILRYTSSPPELRELLLYCSAPNVDTATSLMKGAAASGSQAGPATLAHPYK